MDEKGVDPYRGCADAGKVPGAVRLYGASLHRRGLCGLLYGSDPGVRRGGGGRSSPTTPRPSCPIRRMSSTATSTPAKRTKRRLLAAGAEKVFSLDEIMTAPVNGSGYNEKYGLLGTNKATEDTVKLFPRDCQDLVEAIRPRSCMRPPASAWRSWSTATAPSRIRWARSGSWRTLWFPRPTPPDW